MPVFMWLMKNKSKDAYVKILEYMKQKYLEDHTFTTQLNPPSISSDCELAMIRAVEIVFPNTQILLCTVHIIRNLMRHLRDVDQKWWKNRLLRAMSVIKGCLFLHLSNKYIFAEIDSFLKIINAPLYSA